MPISIVLKTNLPDGFSFDICRISDSRRCVKTSLENDFPNPLSVNLALTSYCRHISILPEISDGVCWKHEIVIMKNIS